MIAGLAAALALAASPAPAAKPAAPMLPAADPIGELIQKARKAADDAVTAVETELRATLYHTGVRGVGALDALGCKVVAMRTVAVDRRLISPRSVLFIKETVGLKMPDGSAHDGYWYASDVGSAIKGPRIDLFTGAGARSMGPARAINLEKLTAVKVGDFKGCPPG